jgi:uncharacterized protein YgiM (DUF1202 family)
MAKFDATATQVAQQPVAAPPTPVATPVPAEELILAEPTATQAPTILAPETGESPTSGVESTVGVVTSDGRLNVRTGPDTAATIVRKLDPGAAVTIVERNADNTWLRLQFDDGATGWVAAEFVQSGSP